MSQQKQTCADIVRQADLSISHDLHVSFGSGEAQLDQLLLEGGVHVHGVGLLTLCLPPRQHQKVSDKNDALHVWADFSLVFSSNKFPANCISGFQVSGDRIGLLTLCLHQGNRIQSNMEMMHFM